MFSFLEGRVVHKRGWELFLSVNGLGFCVRVPPQLSDRTSVGDSLFLWVRSFYREKEKEFVHYGFGSLEEVELFNRLIKVPSVGPQVAFSLIAHLGCEGLIRAIESEDAASLSSVPKVGPKTAKRIVSELSRLEPSGGSKEGYVVEALVSLGYSREEALQAVSQVAIEEGDTEEEILRKVLKRLGEGR